MADKAEQFKKQNAQESQVQQREVDGKKEFLDDETNEWVSKNELKKRQTQRKKAKDAAEKAANKKAAEPKNEKKKAENDDELDPSKYTEIRRKFLQDLRDKGQNPYPHKFNRDLTIPQFRAQYEQEKIANGDFVEDKKVALTGRIQMVRTSGNKLIFIDLTEDNSKVQIFATAANYTGDFEFLGRTLKRGDIIGVEGNPGRTKTGELSVRPFMITPLSYCLHQLPKQKEGENIMNKDTRYRQRYLDLIMNNSVINKFTTRNKITTFVRDYLRNMDFVEVETPMMNMIPGGATARPFETYHNELDMKLYMRIAPELYLKMLIVGGMNRVFEIGKNFRNEGIDMTHNPEFTTCEFYMAYADYNDLMEMTEDMLSKMVYAIHGKYELDYHPDGPENPDNVIKINFAKPFKRIPMMKGLEEAIGVKMPKNTELTTEASREFFDKLCKKHDIKCSAPRTAARLIDKLVGEFIETKCKDPCFITDTPQLMSPLAKWHRSEPGLSERFELFANYHEIINAYTELNDPKVQLEAFQGQASAKDAGDLEAQHVDQSFVTALEYGLPPTGGWGMGIDRITMLLTDSNNIKEVMLFPAMKPNDPNAANEGGEKTKEAGQGDAGKNTLYLTETTQILPKIVNEMCGSNKAEVKNVTAAEYKANKDFQAKNPSMSFPCVETSTGDIVSQDIAVASHLARKCPGCCTLFGENAMQEAQVNQWLAWTETNKDLMDYCVKAIQGHVKDVDQKEFTAKVGEVKGLAKTVNSALNGKTFLVGSKCTLADLAVGSFFTPAFSLFLDAGFQKPMADLTKWYKAFIALPAVVASAGHIKCCVKALKPPTEGGAAKKEAAPKKAEKKDDDMDDLFGSDDEDDGAAAAVAAAAKAKALAGKKPKKVVIAQSLVLFEVKPLDDTTDVDQMARDILAITMDGLYWKTEYRKEPVAYGIFKIIIGVTVEDEKVSVDGLQEKIEAIDDKVQSVEILAFNKI